MALSIPGPTSTPHLGHFFHLSWPRLGYLLKQASPQMAHCQNQRYLSDFNGSTSFFLYVQFPDCPQCKIIPIESWGHHFQVHQSLPPTYVDTFALLFSHVTERCRVCRHLVAKPKLRKAGWKICAAPQAPPWGFVPLSWLHHGTFATLLKKTIQMPREMGGLGTEKL